MLRKNGLLVVLLSFFTLLVASPLFAFSPNKRVLLFVPFENYSSTSYTTVVTDFSAAGYTVDTISSATGSATAEGSSTVLSVPTSSKTTNLLLSLFCFCLSSFFSVKQFLSSNFKAF